MYNNLSLIFLKLWIDVKVHIIIIIIIISSSSSSSSSSNIFKIKIFVKI